MTHNVTQSIKRISLQATVIRADGTEEDLGPVAEYHENPSKRSKLLGGISILNSGLYHSYIASRRA